MPPWLVMLTVVLTMLPAGAPTEDALRELLPLLSAGDTLVDGGNAYYKDSMARSLELSQRGLTAQDVADRLGISLAEAELVHALSKGDAIFDVGEHDGVNRIDFNDGIDGNDGSGEYGSRGHRS